MCIYIYIMDYMYVYVCIYIYIFITIYTCATCICVYLHVLFCCSQGATPVDLVAAAVLEDPPWVFQQDLQTIGLIRIGSLYRGHH